MFTQLTNSQAVADGLKRVIERRAGPDVARRQKLLAVVSAFERCGWTPWLFERAVAEAAPGRLALEQGRLSVTAGGDVLGDVERVLKRYSELSAPCGQE